MRQQTPWPTLREVKEQAVRKYLERTLKRTKGNIAQAARLAGRNRTDLYKLIRRYGVQFKRTSRYGNRGRWQEFGL